MTFLKKQIEKNHATTQKLCRSYYPHRSRDSLSPVCRIFFFFFSSQFITVYRFHRYFLPFFILFHPFPQLFTGFQKISPFINVFSLKKKTIFNRFFTIFNRFFSLTIFNRFPPFCIGTTICKRREIQCLPYAGFFLQDFSFGDISLLVTFQF